MPETAIQPRLSVRMLNKASRQWEDVDESEVPTRFASGQYGLDPNAKLTVVSPNKELGTVAAADLSQVLAQGYRLENAVERHGRELDETYGDRPIEAAVTGAARGLSFGISDVALRKIGVSAERLREVKARNKGAAYSAEAAGVLLPLLFTGGASAVAQGTAKGAIQLVGAAPRAVSKLGQIVERAVAKRLAATGASKTATKTLTRALIENAAPRAAGSFVEG
ncbi:hypothetical protein L0337_05705, partial [candidate division KSB1 bacterium]|nr:hypothetical protein [candidate division KSB1 bacterium]